MSFTPYRQHYGVCVSKIPAVMAIAAVLAMFITSIPGSLCELFHPGFQQLVKSYLYVASLRFFELAFIISSFSCIIFVNMVGCLFSQWCVAISFYQGSANYISLFIFAKKIISDLRWRGEICKLCPNAVFIIRCENVRKTPTDKAVSKTLTKKTRKALENRGILGRWMSLNLGYWGAEGCDGGKWFHSQMAEWVSFERGLKMKGHLRARSVHFTNWVL